MKYRTNFEHVSSVSIPGERYKDSFALKTNDKGERFLERTGRVDQLSYIQSFKDQTDIHSIIQKYNLIKDPSLLNVNEVMYGDFTSIPKTLLEAKRAAENAEAFFNSLPLEIKGAYGYSAASFFADSGSDRFKSILSSYLEPKDVNKPVIPVVKPEPAVVPDDPQPAVIPNVEVADNVS